MFGCLFNYFGFTCYQLDVSCLYSSIPLSDTLYLSFAPILSVSKVYFSSSSFTGRPANAIYLHVIAGKWLVKMNGRGTVLSVIALLQGELTAHLFTMFNGLETNTPVFLSSSLAKARAINLCRASGLDYKGKFNTKETVFSDSLSRVRSLIAVMSDVSSIPSYFSSTTIDVSSPSSSPYNSSSDT